MNQAFKKITILLHSTFFSLLLIASTSISAVSIDDLISDRKISTVKISPDGKTLSFRFLQDGVHGIGFLDRKANQITGRKALQAGHTVGNYVWANNERVVFEVMHTSETSKVPSFRGELFGHNIDGSQSKLIYGYRASEKSVGRNTDQSRERSWGRIIDTLAKDKKHILISSQPWSQSGGKPATTAMLNIYNGKQKKNKGVRSKFAFANFLTDTKGNVRLVSSYREDSSVHLQTQPKIGSDWMEMPTEKFTNEFLALALSGDSESAYVLDVMDRDRLGLYRLSLDGKTFKHLYTNKEVDITQLSLTTDRHTVYAARIDAGEPSYTLFSKSEEAGVFKQLLGSFPGNLVEITSKSRDGRFWVAFVYSDVNPGTYYLFDKKKLEVRHLFNSKPELSSADLAPTKAIKFTTFDGRSVSGFLTKGKSEKHQITKPAPLVVYVHGGPRARDYWGFDEGVQALATNGYSVLQINFRGSIGYGIDFRDAGNMHWGDDVQQDIISGTNWAIENKLASKGNICIMGASFGAYSALQSSILAPDLYNCAIGNAGIYDLTLMYTEGDVETNYGGVEFLEKAIGTDDDLLRKFSPVNNIEKLKTPVFIAHGKEDVRAPFIHAERLREALKTHNKPHEWFVKSNEGHGFYNGENQAQYLNAILAFLDKHTTKN
ncbi:MAG: dipeptidyl aminopeptidase/acylaminoacyl peptidase [Candidatus Azotimanducaceae bacterium]|jgi:dipeptidyl aminopeptidase/acylaminoacyl peptidase